VRAGQVPEDGLLRETTTRVPFADPSF